MEVCPRSDVLLGLYRSRAQQCNSLESEYGVRMRDETVIAKYEDLYRDLCVKWPFAMFMITSIECAGNTGHIQVTARVGSSAPFGIL